MTKVVEILDEFPSGAREQRVQRIEALLLARPQPAGPMQLWRTYEPLEVVHFSPTQAPRPFSPPKDVYGGPTLRLEWQDMNARQPYFHRNSDVDEVSFQIKGERTLMTEMGSVELQPGDFARIPRKVAHDNFGREDIHLIFYMHPDTQDLGTAKGYGQALVPPFPGWKNKTHIEVTTEGLGDFQCDLSACNIDEKLLLEGAKTSAEKIKVVAHSAAQGDTEWLYKATKVWVGSTKLHDVAGLVYRRHMAAEEIQYQVSGERTLVTQRGTVLMRPGDFVSIPMCTSFTSIAQGDSYHLSWVVKAEMPRDNALAVVPGAPRKAPVDRVADATDPVIVGERRSRVPT